MNSTTKPITMLIAAFIPTSAALAQYDAPVPSCPARPGNTVLPAGEAVPPDFVFIQADVAEPGDATWLGIEVHPVPPPLAAHLATGEDGLIVGNIFKDGPADKAGLQRHDILLDINGRKVTSDIQDFMRYVRQLAPGDDVKLIVLRAGTKHEVAFQAGRRPARWEPKYPPEAGGEPYDFRGRILRRGPEGWIVDDLGPIPAPGELPKRLRMYADRLWEKPVSPPPPGEFPEARHVTPEGHVLVVQRKPDGKIEVKRYEQRNGEKSAEIRVYADLKELENADRQAADLLRDAESHHLPANVQRFRDSSERFYREQIDRYQALLKDLDRRTEEYQKNLREWRNRFEQYARENRWEDRWNQWRDRFFQGPLEEMGPPASRPETPPCPMPQTTPEPPDRTAVPPAEPRPGKPVLVPPPPPNVRFETRPDGSVVVHIRHKDTEGSRSYPSEKALQEQAPKLYQQYQELQRRFR